MANPIRLAIIGASARAAAFSALRAGFDVVAADLFADDDLRQRCPATAIKDYPGGFAPWLAKQDVDAWLYAGALENYPDLLDELANVCPLWGNAGDSLRRVRDPLALSQLLAAEDLNFPETIANSNELPINGTWLAKTYRGSSGSGVWLLDSAATIERAHESSAVFQKIVAGIPASAVFALSEIEPKLLGVTEQLVGRPEFGAKSWSYCGSIWRPEWMTGAVGEELNRLANCLANVGLRGLVGVDLVIDGDAVTVIEVNPRFTASTEVVESHLQRSAIAFHACCFGWEAKSAVAARSITSKAILFAKHPANISAEFNLGALDEATLGHLADIPATGTPIDIGQPILTMLGRGGAEELFELASENYKKL